MRWRKFEDSIIINHESISLDSKVKTVMIAYYSRLFIVFATKQNFENFHQLVKDKRAINITQLDCLGRFYLDNQQPYAKDILQVLAEFEPSFEDIRPQICKYLKILDLEELKLLSVQEATNEAVEAQRDGRFDLIWDLFNYYNEDSLKKNKDNADYLATAQELYDLAKLISKANPHYKKAQDECVGILMRLGPSATPEQDHAQLQLKFRHALEGSNQDLTDKLFHQLYGGKLGEETQKNITGDADTLLSLASKIKSLKEENIQLKNNQPANKVKFFDSKVQQASSSAFNFS